MDRLRRQANEFCAHDLLLRLDIYTGLLDDVELRALPEAHLKTALEFDESLLMSADTVYMRPTSVLVAGRLNTKGKAKRVSPNFEHQKVRATRSLIVT